MMNHVTVRAAVGVVAGLMAAFFSTPASAKTATYADPDQPGLTWTFEYDDGWETANLTGFTGTCPPTLMIPTFVETATGGETNFWEVGSLADGFCRDKAELTAVIIPDVTIGDSAFSGCTALSSVTFLGPVPIWLDFNSVFENTPYLARLAADDANDLCRDAKEIAGANGSLADSNMLAKPRNVLGDDDEEETIEPLRGLAGWLVGTKWYKWTAPATTTAWFDTYGSNFNTVLGVYRVEQQEDGSATVTAKGQNNDYNGTTSLVSFNAEKGKTYYVCVGGDQSAEVGGEEGCGRGNIKLGWRTGTAIQLTLVTGTTGKNKKPVTLKAKVPKGKAVGALPTPSRTGYAFQGWYTKVSGGTKIQPTTKLSKAATFYARWTTRRYRLSVKPENATKDGCKSIVGDGTYAHGTKVTIAASAKPGYKFGCWETPECEPTASEFKDYRLLCRKNPSASVTVSGRNMWYEASFVTEADDYIEFSAPNDELPEVGPWYAERTNSISTILIAGSLTYPTVTTTKIPDGATFKLVEDDDTYRFSVPNTSKLAPGRHMVKVTAKNRWGKSATVNLVVFGKNKTAANAWLAGIKTSVLEPYTMNVGITPSFSELNIVPVSGCTITKMAGLPAGLSWDAKKQKFAGYPTKAGTYTFTITATRTVGRTVTAKVSTITVTVAPMPDGLAGTFNGYTRVDRWDHANSPEGYVPTVWEMFKLCEKSKPVTLSVASTGNLTAKVGSSTFTGGGLKEILDATGNRYYAQFHKKTSVKISRTKTRTTDEWLKLMIKPAADRFGPAFDIDDSEYTCKTTTGTTLSVEPDTRISGRLNKFGEDGNGRVKDEEWNLIANLAAERGEVRLYVWRSAADDHRFRFTDSPNFNPSDDTNEYVPVSEMEDGPNGPYPVQIALKVTVNADTGVATLAGAIDGTSMSGTAVLSPEEGYNPNGGATNEAFARFFIGKFVIEVKYPLMNGPTAASPYSGIGEISGEGWTR